MLVMNKLPTAKRVQILSMLVEGSSMRSTARVCDVSLNTVAKLLIDAGWACEEFHNRAVRDLRTQNLGCDEIWSFCYAKRATVLNMKRVVLDAGDVWTFTALDRDTKMMVSWFSGDRDRRSVDLLLRDTASRIANPTVQVSTDGFAGYSDAVSEAFGWDASYGQVQKVFASTPDKGPSKRYSPGIVVAAKK